MNFFKTFLVFSFVASLPLVSETWNLQNFDSHHCKEAPCFMKNRGNRYLPIYIGPEIYHVHRTRHGGSEQSGLVYAIKGGYDRVKRWKVYFGFEALYGKGVLEGKNAGDTCLKSNFTDTFVEGRFGYTLRWKKACRLLFTPFAGVGYFIEKNDFTRPRQTPIHFKISYLYAAAGFLSQINVTEKFNLGLNFKVKFPYESRCNVTNDPSGEDSKQVVNDEIQYRAELPMTYKAFDNCRFQLSLVPFYELRQYGYHPNFPCDFLKTKLNIYGAQLKIIYLL